MINKIETPNHPNLIPQCPISCVNMGEKCINRDFKNCDFYIHLYQDFCNSNQKKKLSPIYCKQKEKCPLPKNDRFKKGCLK
jgi:hypothetical protein